MKRFLTNNKLQTVIAYYFFMISLLYNLVIIDFSKLDIFNIILISIIILCEIFFIVLVMKSILKSDVFPTSLLLKQLIIILTGYFSLEFFNPLIYLLIALLLYLSLKYSTTKHYCQNNHRAYYIVRYRNKYLPYCIYIGYGILTYYLLWLSCPTILSQQALLLLYNAFYPYIIVILIVFSYTLDRKTDYVNIFYYNSSDRKGILLRNLFLIIFGVLLILFK